MDSSFRSGCIEWDGPSIRRRIFCSLTADESIVHSFDSEAAPVWRLMAVAGGWWRMKPKVRAARSRILAFGQEFRFLRREWSVPPSEPVLLRNPSAVLQSEMPTSGERRRHRRRRQRPGGVVDGSRDRAAHCELTKTAWMTHVRSTPPSASAGGGVVLENGRGDSSAGSTRT